VRRADVARQIDKKLEAGCNAKPEPRIRAVERARAPATDEVDAVFRLQTAGGHDQARVGDVRAGP